MSDDSNDQDLALLLQSDRPVIPPRTYKSLDEQQKEIRLAKLRRHNGVIHLTFATSSLLELSEVMPYDALSYYWGPPTDLKIVILEGKEVQIRSSLFSFLEVLLAHGQSRPVWLDVLCINQDDVSERNWQVSMMGDIYKHAALVRSWLGAAEPDTDYALTYTRIDDSTLFNPEVAEKVKNRAREGFRHLLRRPYWERLWIVQEIGLANDIIVHCGKKAVTWTQLMNALHRLEVDSEQSAAREVARNVSELETLRQSLNERGRSEHVSMLQRAVKFGNRLCQDPRDKIYGCRSLAHDSAGTRVDYDMPLVDILLNVCLQSFQSYDHTTGTVVRADCTEHQLTGSIGQAAALVDHINLPLASYFDQLQNSSPDMHVMCEGWPARSRGEVWTLAADDKVLPDDWMIPLPLPRESSASVTSTTYVIIRASPELRTVGLISSQFTRGQERLKHDAITEGLIQPCQSIDRTESGPQVFGLHLDCIAVLLLIDRSVTKSLEVDQETIRNTCSRLRPTTKQLCHCQRVQDSQDNMLLLLSKYQETLDFILRAWNLHKTDLLARESMDLYFDMYQDYVRNDFQLGVTKMHEYGFVEAFKEVGWIKSHLGDDGCLHDVFDYETEEVRRKLEFDRDFPAPGSARRSADIFLENLLG